MAEPPSTTAFLLRRRAARAAIAISAFALTASVIVAQARSIRPLDDCSAFNHQRVLVSRIISGNSLQFRTPAGALFQVRLINVAPGFDAARNALAQRILEKPVTLLLGSPQTRDQNGTLLAFVFPYDGDNLNVDIVNDGLARAEKADASPLGQQVISAEYQARKNRRGLWSRIEPPPAKPRLTPNNPDSRGRQPARI